MTPTVAPFNPSLAIQFSRTQKLTVAQKKSHCVNVLGRYGRREDAAIAARRLADCARWTAGTLAVITCKTCRGYHIFVRRGE